MHRHVLPSETLCKIIQLLSMNKNQKQTPPLSHIDGPDLSVLYIRRSQLVPAQELKSKEPESLAYCLRIDAHDLTGFRI